MSPLSHNEHVALARVLLGARKQLQDISDLFSTRYGRDSSIAETAVKTLVSAALLEHEFLQLDGAAETQSGEVETVETDVRSQSHSSF